MWLIGHARELGMTVRELLARTTSAELSEQMAYDIHVRRRADEAERERALNQTAQQGLDSIKREVRGGR